MQSVRRVMHGRHVGLQTEPDLTQGSASGIYQHLDEAPEWMRLPRQVPGRAQRLRTDPGTHSTKAGMHQSNHVKGKQRYRKIEIVIL